MVFYLLGFRMERVIEILKGESATSSYKEVEDKYIHKKGAQYGKIAN
ncbi:hypothetical protein II1_01977 [Bacillus cereus MC118]|uniref:Uncharacterized protein n=1 Tax=Bacillus cereus MC67 TaxID=1053219 RepID=J8FIQ4_BACCE|nr:hypothetical protein II3_02355 [Bacillus cereus MC67]EOP16403.1 hypothetical protein II1_01977 [Bacillus cereus MC118]